MERWVVLEQVWSRFGAGLGWLREEKIRLLLPGIEQQSCSLANRSQVAIQPTHIKKIQMEEQILRVMKPNYELSLLFDASLWKKINLVFRTSVM